MAEDKPTLQMVLVITLVRVSIASKQQFFGSRLVRLSID